MTDEFKSNSAIRAALQELADVVTRENMPDPGEGFLGFFGLPPGHRRILFVLDLIATHNRGERLEGRVAALDNSSGMRPPRHVITAPKPASVHTPARPPVAGVSKYVPEEFGDLLPRAKELMTSEAPPQQHPTIGGSAENPTFEKPGNVGSVIPIPATAPVPRPEPALASITPQPGGGASMPSRSSGSETIAVVPIDTVKKTVYLKNARSNEAYEVAVELDGLKGLKLEDAGGSGLTLDEASGFLKGFPTVSGDFVIRLQGLLNGKRCDVVANLAVIPDPKSLWVSKDSDRSAPFWKSDEAFDRKEGDLLCVSASKRGRSHAKDGTFRDDDFGLLASGSGGWHIAVVADGAGSAKFSRRGSKVAVDSVIQELPKLLEDHVSPHLSNLVPAHLQGNPDAAVQIKSQLYQSLATAAFNAAKAIEGEAALNGEKASAFSTTLIVTVVRKVLEGWFIAAFSVGDGGAAVFDVREGSLTTLTLPDSGEFAGQTRFLQKSEFTGGYEEVAKRIFFDIRKDFTAVALMTDGISDPKFPTDSVFADPSKWVEFWNGDLTKAVDFSLGNTEMESQFLGWLDFWSPGNHDDRTLAVLVPARSTL